MYWHGSSRRPDSSGSNGRSHTSHVFCDISLETGCCWSVYCPRDQVPQRGLLYIQTDLLVTGTVGLTWRSGQPPHLGWRWDCCSKHLCSIVFLFKSTQDCDSGEEAADCPSGRGKTEKTDTDIISRVVFVCLLCLVLPKGGNCQSCPWLIKFIFFSSANKTEWLEFGSWMRCCPVRKFRFRGFSSERLV